MNFLIIRRFLFLRFFDDYFVLLAQMGIEETPST